MGSKLHKHLISSTHRNLVSSEHDFIISNVNDSVWFQIHNHISLILSGEAVSLDGATATSISPKQVKSPIRQPYFFKVLVLV